MYHSAREYKVKVVKKARTVREILWGIPSVIPDLLVCMLYYIATYLIALTFNTGLRKPREGM